VRREIKKNLAMAKPAPRQTDGVSTVRSSTNNTILLHISTTTTTKLRIWGQSSNLSERAGQDKAANTYVVGIML
jgi:hypothetical protein